MSYKPTVRALPRGRIAQWGRERLDALSTLELQQLLDNARRLKETELAATCDEILGTRPYGRPRAARANRLVAFAKAFEKHGISVRSRRWSRGGIRTDGAVVMCLPAGDVRTTEDGDSCLLWAPNDANEHPWSDTPGGQERLEHCRIALERGAAEGLLSYSKGAAAGAEPGDDSVADLKVDAAAMLSLRIEKRGEQYWARWNEKTAEAK